MNDLLRLNLQFFSEEADDAPNEDAPQEDVESTEEAEVKESVKDEKTFTQEEVNALIQDRLARDRKAREDAEEKERLEEQGEYKALLEKANETIAALEAEKALSIRKETINSALVAKGLNAEEVAKYAKYVDKLVTSDDEIPTAVDEVYNDFIAAKQASIKEPSAGFGDSKDPEPKDAAELGRELYKRIRR